LTIFQHGVLDPNQGRFRRFAFFFASSIMLEGMMAQTTLAYLEQRHTALEREIADALHRRPADDSVIADLKYRRLIIADEIQHNRRLVERFAFPG
jgi:hypothetical protein